MKVYHRDTQNSQELDVGELEKHLGILVDQYRLNRLYMIIGSAVTELLTKITILGSISSIAESKVK